MEMSPIKIGCVIVLYNPSEPLLEKVIESIDKQVHTIFFADNSDHPANKNFGENSIYRKMDGNVGIAAAQNEGIRYFLTNHYTHLFFLDQDSVLSIGLVDQLLKDLQQLQGAGLKVGAIGARPFNRESGKKYQASVTKGSRLKLNITEVGEIMNSASLIPSENFIDVGFFDEGLFIDGVDHEWCWRAKKNLNFRFFISENAKISHYLGEGDRFFLIRPIAIPTPFRAYYQFRNYFILSKRSYVPSYWKWKNGIKFFIRFFYLSLCVKPKRIFFKKCIQGIYDGIKQQ